MNEPKQTKEGQKKKASDKLSPAAKESLKRIQAEEDKKKRKRWLPGDRTAEVRRTVRSLRGFAQI